MKNSEGRQGSQCTASSNATVFPARKRTAGGYELKGRSCSSASIFTGTLAHTEHRAHFLYRPVRTKDWQGFYAACDKDEPCHPIIQTLLALDATGATVEIWAGRSDEVRDRTTAWLGKHGLGHIPIRTRATGDHRADTVLKDEWLDEGRMLMFDPRV